MLPMRRETDILIEELPTETLVYDTKRHKVHCLNKTAALLWRSLFFRRIFDYSFRSWVYSMNFL